MKKLLKGLCAALAVAMTITALPTAALAKETEVQGEALLDYVTGDRVNFRKAPNLDAEVLEILDSGTAVRVAIYEGGEDGWSEVVHDALTGYIKTEFLLTPEEYAALPKVKLELLTWGEAKGVARVGLDLRILDIRSGITYTVRSFSNGNHADVEPISKEDTAAMKRSFGGRWDWDPRPVWVTVNGRILAASINGMPHGGGVISGNGMDGQVCLHFKGSTTHNGNRSHERDHQAAVNEAWAARY